MCKYCEEVKTRTNTGTTFYVRYGGASIVFDAEDVGFLLQVPDGYTYSITHCPWCGRKLELPDEEEELSAEDEIARLEERINRTNLRISNLCASLDSYLDYLRSNGTASFENRNQTRQAIQHIQNN